MTRADHIVSDPEGKTVTYDKWLGNNKKLILNEALRQLELGKIETAKALIPQEELDRMAEAHKKHKQLAEMKIREEAEKLLSRTRVRIRMLKLNSKNSNRYAEIGHCYPF